MSAKPYSHQSHIERVLKGSKSRLGARIVLQHLCTRSEFKSPTVTITKPQIIDATNLERKAVQRALLNLRGEGSILPIKNTQGGRGVAVTYELIALDDLRFGESVEPEQDGRKARMAMIAEILAKPENTGMPYGVASAMARKVYPMDTHILKID